jgi:hypothetical protein
MNKGKQTPRNRPRQFKAGEAVESILQAIKEKLFEQYRTYARRPDHLLRLALNEAEALAWQSGYPALVFPVLATEKAEAAVAYGKKQQCIQQKFELALQA